MKPLLCLRHEPPDDLGVAEEAFRSQGISVELVDLWKDHELPPPGDVAGAVSLGGEMNVDQTDVFPFLAAERAFLRRAVAEETPFLGICLGGQLLARVAGAPVSPSPARELGFVPLRPTPAAAGDPVLGCLRDGDRIFQWHRDTFSLPPGATLLAAGDAVRNQAFRLGDRAWGLQFHPEITAEELDDWLEAAGDIPEREYGRTTDEVREEARRLLPAQQERSRELFAAFAALVRGNA